MGISCACVYSDADINSVYVRQADESRYIGPSLSCMSYLSIEKICKAAIEMGVQAVHPGYGFLAENPDFPRVLQKHNIAFIGPSAEIIEVIANKITAKEAAKKAGVNAVPGYVGKISNASHAASVAEEIGFPIILKAASGGGGKGMRIVNSREEIELAFTSATNEAEKNFNDRSIFMEKYIELSRHIEVQIIADKYGNAVCLGERECSLQRNNQKVIEETPSPFISDKIRQEMYDKCISLAKEVGYFSAGTIEFIVDNDQNFYFLEVNTRLQVEHPVTEFVTGVDIVEEMIRISWGEKLRFSQDDIKLTGSAIESRICAEDPSRRFFPSSGRIKYYDKPDRDFSILVSRAGVILGSGAVELSPKRSPRKDFDNCIRIDDGIVAGSEVSVFYDSMITKVITYGKDRIEAISRMQEALSECYIEGVANNIEFLESIFHHPSFVAAKLYTRFISDYYPNGFYGDFVTEEYIKMFIFTALYVYLENEEKCYYKAVNETPLMSFHRVGESRKKELLPITTTQMATCDTKMRHSNIVSISDDVEVTNSSARDLFIVRINDNEYSVNARYQNNALTMVYNHNIYSAIGRWKLSYRLLCVIINADNVVTFKVQRQDNRLFIRHAGMQAECYVFKPHVAELDKFILSNKKERIAVDVVKSPISGLLVKLHVNVGDQVVVGQPLFIVEAMKMENIICAESEMVIKHIPVQEGNNIQVGDVICFLK
ncbi:ATP-binding protein [Wolbachia endosymbiont of Cruorifilaria tuberocauda]|uniref:ATP-binding protein n=1 Tax=Wolbachia endosymbiont of Cruorifilaria tuberocauda TaxID=1812111 RepID=UPI001FE3C628|nr:biotin carboxylase N-terminal domain-containing protein [Wolbachia endosymbiont of Cruorifilaria tuberocauda]